MLKSARDDKTHQTSRVVCANTKVFEHAEADRALFRVVSRQNGQLGADRNATEHLGLAADVDNASRNEARDDELGVPASRHHAGLPEGRLRLDVEDIAAELADVRVVGRVHVNASNAEVVTLDLCERIREDGGRDRGNNRDVRVRTAGERVEAVDGNSIKDGEDAVILSSLDLRLAEVLHTLEEVVTTLLDLRQRGLGEGRDLEKREDDAAGLSNRRDRLAFLTDHVRDNVRILIVNRERTVRELLDQEGLAANGRVIATLAERLDHRSREVTTTSAGSDELIDNLLFDGVIHHLYAVCHFRSPFFLFLAQKKSARNSSDEVASGGERTTPIRVTSGSAATPPAPDPEVAVVIQSASYESCQRFVRRPLSEA